MSVFDKIIQQIPTAKVVVDFPDDDMRVLEVTYIGELKWVYASLSRGACVILSNEERVGLKAALKDGNKAAFEYLSRVAV